MHTLHTLHRAHSAAPGSRSAGPIGRLRPTGLIPSLMRALPILVLTVLPSLAEAATPFAFDTAPGRLPKDVVPLDYRIKVIPNLAKLTLAGKEEISLDVRSASATIQFNSLNETLSDVRVDGKPVAGVASDNDKQLTTVTLSKPLNVGRHALTFSYTGKIENSPVGLFLQPYVKPGGGKGQLLSTQFEATDARRMFPCWDEPSFRATFQLSVTVPAAWNTLSNTQIARRTVQGKLATTTFKRTPRMPSYLVEFSAGELGHVEATKDGVVFGVWTVRGQETQGATALANAQQILADYNDYFGVPYPLPKLDSIAVPGGFSGAMENWGAITYNDQTLLLSSTSTAADRQLVYGIQAHEMAHQWNGDLVTMGWWDDLWLNESFASWRAAKEVDQRNPSWHWWDNEDRSKESAMSADARINSHAIEQHVTDELQATNAFDPQITYNKGQAVLRMLEAYLGDDTFRDGIRLFMKTHAFGNATAADLWDALSKASGQDVAKIAAAWTEQAGFPLVSASAQCDASGKRTVTLSQGRFLLQGKDTTAVHWGVPLQVRSGSSAVPKPALLVSEGQTLSAGQCDEALSLNAGALGFYRVEYDDATLKANTRAFASLKASDQIALLDDQWALAQSGAQPLPAYLTLVTAMGSNRNERAWEQIVSALAQIEQYERGTPGHDAFARYAVTQVRPVAEAVGWDARPDETPGTVRLRRRVLDAMGAWGDPAVIAEARKRFQGFLAKRSSVAPDDQEHLLAIVAREADAATFEQLHSLAKTAQNENELRRFYGALMQVRDPQLAADAARIALSDEIPVQAAALRLQLVGEIESAQPTLAWKTFTANVDALLQPHQPFGPLILAQFSPELFWDALPPDELEAWIKARVPAEMSTSLARGMEGARFRLAQKTALVKAADEYLGGGKTAAR